MESEPPNPGYLSLIPVFILLANPGGLAFSILMLILFLGLSGMISGSEIAYFSLNPKDIETLKSEEGRVSKRIISLVNKPRKLLATILISNNFINIAIIIISDQIVRNIFPDALFNNWAASLSDTFFFNLFSTATLARAFSFTIAVIGATFILVLFGEVAPKIYASLNNIKFARAMSWPLSFLLKVFHPISKLMVNMSNSLEKRLEDESSKRTSKEDIDTAIDLVSIEDDTIEEIDILKSILKFNDVPVKQIMRARVDVIALEDNESFDKVLGTIKETGFSRYPVYNEDKDSIVGILHVKDILEFLDESNDFDWKKHMRTNVLFVPEYKKINGLLKEFQSKHSHMAIVVDEYGGSEGIVTLEDVMEEVIGEIKDEFHDFEDIEYTKIDDHNYIFEGKTMLNDVSRIIGKDTSIFDDVRGDSDSLAGLILELTGQIPNKNREIVFDSLKFSIQKVSKRRIEEIKLTIEPSEE